MKIEDRIIDAYDELAPDIWDQLEENIQIEQRLSRKPEYLKKWGFQLIPVCMMVMLLFGFQYREQRVIANIHLDINPSICIGVNYANEIVKIYGENKDGEEIVKELHMRKKQSLEAGIVMITKELYKKGYLKDNAEILISVSGKEQDAIRNMTVKPMEKIAKIEKVKFKIQYQKIEADQKPNFKQNLKQNSLQEEKQEKQEIKQEIKQHNKQEKRNVQKSKKEEKQQDPDLKSEKKEKKKKDKKNDSVETTESEEYSTETEENKGINQKKEKEKEKDKKKEKKGDKGNGKS